MTLSLLTRGYICPGDVSNAITTRGYICFPEVVIEVVLPPVKQIVFNKDDPGIFIVPEHRPICPPTILTGQKQPFLAAGQSPGLLKGKNQVIYSKQEACKITGAQLVEKVGEKELVLSTPKSPVVVTSSGISVPDIFDKC